MAWTIGNVQSSPGSVATPATSAILTAPTGITDNDILFAVVACDIAAGGDPGAVSITGFTQISSHYTPAGFQGSIRLTLLYKIASSESGNYTANWANSANCAWSITTISGNATASPIDESATNADTSASSVSIIAPSLTALTAADDLLLCAFTTCGGGDPYTPDAGLTFISNNNQSNSDSVFLAVGYKVLNSSSATGTFTTTTTGGNPNEAASVAIKAVGGGGGGATDDIATRSGSIFVV